MRAPRALPGERLDALGCQPYSDQRPKGLRERSWDPTVLVRGSIAVVWTPDDFWRDGNTTHCGIDVFDLVKQEGAWRIADAMYTVEPGACPELRPADPPRIRPTPWRRRDSYSMHSDLTLESQG